MIRYIIVQLIEIKTKWEVSFKLKHNYIIKKHMNKNREFKLLTRRKKGQEMVLPNWQQGKRRYSWYNSFIQVSFPK